MNCDNERYVKDYVQMVMKDINHNWYHAVDNNTADVAYIWCQQQLGRDGWLLPHHESKWYVLLFSKDAAKFYFKYKTDYTRFVLTWL
jgi:hypothetical protein